LEGREVILGTKDTDVLFFRPDKKSQPCQAPSPVAVSFPSACHADCKDGFLYGKWKYILTEWAVYNKIGKVLAA